MYVYIYIISRTCCCCQPFHLFLPLSIYVSDEDVELYVFFVLKVQALEQNEKFGCAAVFCFRNAAPFCLRCTCLWSSSQSSVRWRKFLCAVLPVGIFVCFHSQSTGNSFCVQFYLWVSLCTFSVSLLETVFVHSFTSGYLCVPSQSVSWKQFLYFSFSKEKWTPSFRYEDYKEDAPLLEFMYFVFTCMPGESYHG